MRRRTVNFILALLLLSLLALSATVRPFVLVLSPDDLIDDPASTADGDDSSTSEWDESDDSDSLSMIIAILPSDEPHHDATIGNAPTRRGNEGKSRIALSPSGQSTTVSPMVSPMFDSRPSPEPTLLFPP
ncbi:hypothetical protein U1Q18_020879 [Sarracenia purpurea var. burkii]